MEIIFRWYDSTYLRVRFKNECLSIRRNYGCCFESGARPSRTHQNLKSSRSSKLPRNRRHVSHRLLLNMISLELDNVSVADLSVVL
jgi:hypothetical protein